jgi:ATP adenylyltransferase
MEHIWSPWRYQYITSAEKQPGCIFCNLIAENADQKNGILFRGALNYIILNLFPYTSGHLMVVPYQHSASLVDVDQATSTEMMELSKKVLCALESEYRPHGFNAGFNFGQSAGAGVAEHIHMHVVPRWSGDANFMTVIGETRILPEELGNTYQRLKKHFVN